MNLKRPLPILIVALALASVVALLVWRFAKTPDIETPSDVVPAVMTEDEIFREMVSIERDLKNIAEERADIYIQMGESREKAEKENEEVARLVREFQEDRAILVDHLNRLEGVPERLKEIESLREDSRTLLGESKEISSELKVRRAEQSVIGRLDDVSDMPEVVEELNADLARLQKRQTELYSNIKRNQQDMSRLQREIEAIHDRARKDDWQIKELHMRAQEKQLTMQVRRDAAAGTWDSRQRLNELDERHKEHLARHRELETRLSDLKP